MAFPVAAVIGAAMSVLAAEQQKQQQLQNQMAANAQKLRQGKTSEVDNSTPQGASAQSIGNLIQEVAKGIHSSRKPTEEGQSNTQNTDT